MGAGRKAGGAALRSRLSRHAPDQGPGSAGRRRERRMLLQERGRRMPGAHVGMVDEPAEEAEVGRRPGHACCAQRPGQVVEGLFPGLAVRDQLGDQRVVGHRDLVAGLDPGVHAHGVRELEALETAGLRQEGQRVLGVEAHLDRVAFGLARLDRQGLAGGDEQLLLDEVDAGDELGDGMLDLQPRVELEEVEALAVQHELGGPGVLVPDGAREGDGRLAHRGTQALVERGGGALLEHLLVAALDRAVALAEVDRRCRGGRPGPGSRRAADARRSARRRPGRHGSRPPPRGWPPPSPPGARRASARRAFPARRPPRRP